MDSYNLNYHFSRPDEDNATVYYGGYCLEATSRDEAVRKLRSRSAHLTILSEPHVWAVVSEDGDVTFRDYRDLDYITRERSVFKSFAELLDAKGGYRPTIHLSSDDAVALADAYDAAQAARGDNRRVYRRNA